MFCMHSFGLVCRSGVYCSLLAFRYVMGVLQRVKPFFTLLTTTRPRQKPPFYKCVKGKNMQSRPANQKQKSSEHIRKKNITLGFE